jgi:hypothetical protein
MTVPVIASRTGAGSTGLVDTCILIVDFAESECGATFAAALTGVEPAITIRGTFCCVVSVRFTGRDPLAPGA